VRRTAVRVDPLTAGDNVLIVRGRPPAGVTGSTIQRVRDPTDHLPPPDEHYDSWHLVEGGPWIVCTALPSAMRGELVLRNVAKAVQVKAPRYEVGRLSVDQARTLLRCSQPDRFARCPCSRCTWG
jgi:hypothetical protein